MQRSLSMARAIAFPALALTVATILVFAGSARAEPSNADRTAIRAVITAQMEAFKRDDGPAAFAFAAPGIQAMFGSPANFMAMVRGGYQAVYRPRSVVFGALEERGGDLVQVVAVVGPDGMAMDALYSMEQQPDGSWKIAGCVLVKRPGVST